MASHQDQSLPVIRPYQSTDLPVLHRIDQVCFRRGVAYSLAELRSFVTSDDSMTLVAEDQKENICGFIISQLERRRRGEPSNPSLMGHILTIDVLPDFRDRGIGTQLLGQAEEWLRHRDAVTVLVETASDNQSAVAFYQKHGYRVVDLLKDYYSRGSDAYLMVKRLSEYPFSA